MIAAFSNEQPTDSEQPTTTTLSTTAQLRTNSSFEPITGALCSQASQILEELRGVTVEECAIRCHVRPACKRFSYQQIISELLNYESMPYFSRLTGYSFCTSYYIIYII